MRPVQGHAASPARAPQQPSHAHISPTTRVTAKRINWIEEISRATSPKASPQQSNRGGSRAGNVFTSPARKSPAQEVEPDVIYETLYDDDGLPLQALKVNEALVEPLDDNEVREIVEKTIPAASPGRRPSPVTLSKSDLLQDILSMAQGMTAADLQNIYKMMVRIT